MARDSFGIAPVLAGTPNDNHIVRAHERYADLYECESSVLDGEGNKTMCDWYGGLADAIAHTVRNQFEVTR